MKGLWKERKKAVGLFSKKTMKLCEICHGEVGIQRLQIRDGYVCKYCAADIWMDHAMLPYQTAEEIKEHLRYRSENKKRIEAFRATREIQAGSYYFRVDDHKKQWYVGRKNTPNPPVFSFAEVVDYEYSEDGETITTGGVGRAAVGGMLFGATGAVIGGLTGGRTKSVVRSMKVKISLHNKYVKHCEIELLVRGAELKVGSMTYNFWKRTADNLLSALDSMVVESQNSGTETSAPSSADEIRKYKQLYDDGIITQDEFEAKKRQLLGL